jgi:Uma2 family endonuclease
MAPETSTKMTYEDLPLLPEDGLRHEIIDGEHYVNASPATEHQRVSLRLVLAIGKYLEDNQHEDTRLGDLFFQTFHSPLVLSQLDVVEPDLLYIASERREIVKAKSIQGAPDLLVEILSDSGRVYDEVTKHALYERAGIGEYWIVDPSTETVRVFCIDAADHYGPAAELYRNDILTSSLFPSLEMQLSRIFV